MYGKISDDGIIMATSNNVFEGAIDMGVDIIIGGHWDGTTYTAPNPDTWTRTRAWFWALDEYCINGFDLTQRWHRCVIMDSQDCMDTASWDDLVTAYQGAQ